MGEWPANPDQQTLVDTLGSLAYKPGMRTLIYHTLGDQLCHGPKFVSASKQARRKTYRAQMRAELRGLAIFAVVLYVMTFAGVALFLFADGVIGSWFFHVHHSADEAPLALACFWPNLIVTIFLIAIAVLYVSGGPAGIPFASSGKNEKDRT